MAKKGKKFDYFDAFEEQAKIAIEEAQLLNQVVGMYDYEGLMANVERAHKIEHEGDIICHAVYDALTVEFLAPLDREDIVELARGIDEVTDKMESVIQRFYMLDIQKMRPEALEFAKLLIRSTEALEVVLEDFRNFKRSKKIRHLLRDVSDIEEEGDRLFFETVHALHAANSDTMEVLVWGDIYQRLEDALDACKGVSETIGSVLMKNS